MKWQRTTPSVIYSGIEPEFFSSGSGDEDRPARFSVNLIGSLYFPDKLGDCLEGFKAWFESLALDQQRLVTINYLGADVELMTATASRHWPQMPLHVPGYLHVTAMARLCKAAAANAYIANATTFHHKLLELLACGRPVIAFPSERLESIQLASTLGGGLVVADSPEAMASILRELHTSWLAGLAGTLPASRSDVARDLSWPAQADKLEQVLARVVNGPV